MDGMEMTMEELFGPVIYSYTRSQAIDDGVLVDVTELAKEAGFSVPVAMTIGAWTDLVGWDETNGAHQDEKGRLWDVLSVILHRIRTIPPGSHGLDRLDGYVLRIPNKPGATRALRAPFWVYSGPGDNGKHVLTIMLPGED
jgi:hypothetical protein